MNDSALVQAAVDAAGRAYVPYSNFHVGAALESVTGQVFTGCNVENAAYPATICAERTALVKAVSEGERQFTRLAVVSKTGGAPCGTCRQMLYEFAPDLWVIIARLDGTVVAEMSLSDLLPHGFGPSDLRGDS